ncbi:MAG: hypothetical protein OXC92_02640 [Flavobacteriaceae bacterium]|nr:hypothetical protein [Flavobacteriaceae bacterium]
MDNTATTLKVVMVLIFEESHHLLESWFPHNSKYDLLLSSLGWGCQGTLFLGQEAPIEHEIR